MIRNFMLGLVAAGVTMVLPVYAVVAVAAQPTSRDSGEAGGVCTDLGCRGGNTKCADGKLTLPDGGTATYTCYTTIAEQ
ncbi:MAG: hypothetical protein C0497_13375 [Gemmatimonas sp.]|nr:hypothetical protein [Gemmatimonas sp.]